MVLDEIVQEVTASMSTCRALLPQEQREAFDNFLSGYLTFHYLAPRYRLSEVIML